MFNYLIKKIKPQSKKEPLFTKNMVEDILENHCGVIRGVYFGLDFINEEFFIIRVVDDSKTFCFKCYSIYEFYQCINMYMKGYNAGTASTVKMVREDFLEKDLSSKILH
jgi:hypothetical protein